MRKRGVLYLHWGADESCLQRSLASLREHHPELPVHVARLPENSTLLAKAQMFDLSPFEETLFLDRDTVVLGRLDFGFEMARKHGLACCICEMPWARRYGGLDRLGDLVEFNSGVLFFTRAAEPIFKAWQIHTRIDSSILFYHGSTLCKMPLNDQAAFAVAIAEQPHPPFTLPLNWNFRPSWHRSWWGPIKVWHDYNPPPAEVLAFVAQQSQPSTVLEYRTQTPEI